MLKTPITDTQLPDGFVLALEAARVWDFPEKPTPHNRSLGMHPIQRHRENKARWPLLVRSICQLPPAGWCTARASPKTRAGKVPTRAAPLELAVGFPVRVDIYLQTKRRSKGRRYGQDKGNRYASVKPIEDALVWYGWARDDDDYRDGGWLDVEVHNSHELEVPMRVAWVPIVRREVLECGSVVSATP